MHDAILFVYGTLRRGSPHAVARQLAREARWLGRAEATGRLVRCDWYPAMIPGGDRRVIGDLYRLRDPALSFVWLDAFEGCGHNDPAPHDYRRTAITVSLKGEQVLAQTYVWIGDQTGLHLIPTGDWLKA